MIEKEIKTVEREFELGDLFIFRRKRGCYSAGDFIILRENGRRTPMNEYRFDSPGTIIGTVGAATGGRAWLNEMLDAGDITYEGNLK